MLRRGRLRLVAAALLALLLAGCGPKVVTDSDSDPAPAEAVLAAAHAVRIGQVDVGLAAFSALAEAHPDSWEAARGLQDARRRSMRPEEFEDLYVAAHQAAPESALAWYLLGRARIERPGEAMAAFDEAEARAPRNPWPVAAKAYLHGASGNRYLSVQTYERGIERMPRSAKLRLLLGNELLRLQLLVDAQRHLEFGHRLAPDDPLMTAALGKAYVELGRHDTGKVLLEEALAANPNQPDVSMSLARLVLLDRDVERAEALYRQALEGGSPPDTDFYAEIRAARIAVQAAR